jgi:hypothetical protein
MPIDVYFIELYTIEKKKEFWETRGFEGKVYKFYEMKIKIQRNCFGIIQSDEWGLG